MPIVRVEEERNKSTMRSLRAAIKRIAERVESQFGGELESGLYHPPTYLDEMAERDSPLMRIRELTTTRFLRIIPIRNYRSLLFVQSHYGDWTGTLYCYIHDGRLMEAARAELNNCDARIVIIPNYE